MVQDLLDGMITFYSLWGTLFKSLSLSAEIDLPARVARSSCRKHRLMVDMTKSSFNRAVQKLNYHPYKLITKYVFSREDIHLDYFCYIRHKLSPADVPRRLAMCESVIQKNVDDPSWLPKLWTSDEANFNLNGKI